MKRFRFAAILAFGVSGAAHADPLVFSPFDPAPISRAGMAYVSFGGGAAVQQLPTFNSPYTANTTRVSLFTVAPNVTGGAGQITLGAILNGSPVGNNSRIELSLGGFDGSGRVTGGASAFNTDVHPVDGTAPHICNGGCDATTTLKFDYREIGGVLRLKSDVALVPLITMTPSIGMVASQSRLHYRSDTPFFASAFGVSLPAFVEETINTFRAGGEFGLNFGFRATQQLTFNAGATVALLAMSSKLDGNDCLSLNNLPLGAACDGLNLRTFVTQTETRFDNRDRFNLSGTYDDGWMKFTLAGFCAWDSAMPGVVNPTFRGTGPAVISYEQRWSYGGSAALTVPFVIPR